jgi:hypothetical protein
MLRVFYQPASTASQVVTWDQFFLCAAGLMGTLHGRLGMGPVPGAPCLRHIKLLKRD